jgi:hypothetical protein
MTRSSLCIATAAWIHSLKLVCVTPRILTHLANFTYTEAACYLAASILLRVNMAEPKNLQSGSPNDWQPIAKS